MARRRERLRSARDPCREPARGRAPALRLDRAASRADELDAARRPRDGPRDRTTSSAAACAVVRRGLHRRGAIGTDAPADVEVVSTQEDHAAAVAARRDGGVVAITRAAADDEAIVREERDRAAAESAAVAPHAVAVVVAAALASHTAAREHRDDAAHAPVRGAR